MDDIRRYIFEAGAPIPIARMGGGKAAILIPKRITANGEYNPADDGADGYTIVTVDVPQGGGTLIAKLITANGVYNPVDDGADGYSLITVDVPADRLGLSALSYDTIDAVCGMAGYAVIGYADVIAGIATFVEV